MSQPASDAAFDHAISTINGAIDAGVIIPQFLTDYKKVCTLLCALKDVGAKMQHQNIVTAAEVGAGDFKKLDLYRIGYEHIKPKIFLCGTKAEGNNAYSFDFYNHRGELLLPHELLKKLNKILKTIRITQNTHNSDSE